MTQFLEAVVIEGRGSKQSRLDFDPGVNIITGVSSKGKSAVLHIIAYCLGAARCDVPLGKVRDYASWYFLVLNVGKGRAVIGRKAPVTGTQVSDEAYFAHGSNPTVPRPVHTTHTVWSACRSLGDLIGLPRGEFRLQDESLYEDLDAVQGSIEMRDVLPLLLQPQDVIATRRLFASFTDRPPKSRAEMMKIALGIVSPNVLQLRSQQDKLIRRKRALEREEKVQKDVYEKAMDHLGHIWQQAIIAGILASRPLISPDQARDELENLKNLSTIEVEASSSATDNKELAELDAKSQALRRELRQIHRDLRQLSRLKQLAREADVSLHAESSRMRVVDVLGLPMQTEVACPLCGSAIGGNTVSVLAEMQAELDAELAFMASIPPDLDAAESSLQDSDVRIRQDLRETERRLDELRKQEPALTLTQHRVERERKIGSLETALGVMPATPGRPPGLDAVDAELNEVDNKLQSLPEERHVVDVALGLSSRMTSVAREFDRVKLKDGFLSFDATFSTIEREQGGKKEPLAILGGAEIHVMYHLATFLGLHEYLSEPETKSFIPRFLVLDQPSQAYFPADSDKSGTDMDAVRSIYDLLFRFAARLGNRIQIIALDHADFSAEDERFRRVRRDWHGKDGLITDDDTGGPAA